jgi:hypothetical protein
MSIGIPTEKSQEKNPKKQYKEVLLKANEI